MENITCDFTTQGDLLPYLSLPLPTLDALVAKCQIVCLLTYGTGNPDLAGVGVVISYAMELVLAMLFGPILFFDFHLLPAFRPKYTPTFISRWFHSHQHTSLWSQLFFSFTVSLACCVRQYQESCAFYEAATITQVVGVTVIGLSLTLTGFYQKIERMPVFVFFFVSTLALSATAVIAPISTLTKFDGLIQACGELSESRSLPWGTGFLERYNRQAQFPELFSDVALILALNAIWCYLWLRRKHWIQGQNRGGQGKIWINRTLIILSFLICIPLLRAAWICFDFILFRRNVLKMAWQQSLGENAWGIGQIGATLAWAPLLVEMTYSAFRTLLQQRQQEGNPPPTSSETNVVMPYLEAGKLQVTDLKAATLTGGVSGADKSDKRLPLDSINLSRRIDMPLLATQPLPWSLQRRNTG